MTRENPKPREMVIVVDDDESMRVALTYLFRSMDIDVMVFGSAAEVLSSRQIGRAHVLTPVTVKSRMPSSA